MNGASARQALPEPTPARPQGSIAFAATINATELDKYTEMTRRKRKKERRPDRRLRPHLLRDEWHMFTPDSEKRAKLEEGLERGLSVYEAALEAGHSDRHARRFEWCG